MTRYAIYGIPGVLDSFDASDAPEAVRLRETVEAWYARAEWRDLTVDARRYGFHATLTSPFHLAEGVTEAQLLATAEAFAAARASVTIPAIAPQPLGAFRALAPQGDTAGVDALAADAVRVFHDLRAPLTDLEVRRRRPEQLTERQRELLAEWGYPYVLDEFRFHMTLTDAIPDDRATEIDAALASHFAEVRGVDIPLRSIAVCVESAPGADFAVHSVHPFASTSQEGQ